MKAAISSAGPGLDSGIDPRFGRCAYLVFYDLESGEWEAVPNANRDAGGGAGIRTAQLVIDRGAGAVVTGNIGPNAMQVLSGQVKVFTGFQGTVSEAVQALTRKAGCPRPPPPPSGTMPAWQAAPQRAARRPAPPPALRA